MNSKRMVSHVKILLVALAVLASTSAKAQETSYVTTCWHSHVESTMPFYFKGGSVEFRPECAPDVLYSWQPDDEIDWNAFTRSPLPKGYLYTFRTPLATFGYGDVQIRIKLKAGVRFRYISSDQRHCDSYSSEERSSTVFVAYLDWIAATDYILCSPDVVESWSARTLGSRMEAEKEMAVLEANRSNPIQSYDSYRHFPDRRKYFVDISKNSYFMELHDPRTDWSSRTLQSRYDQMDRSFNSSTGRIHTHEKNEARHQVHQVVASRHFDSKLPGNYFALSKSEQLRALKDAGVQATFPTNVIEIIEVVDSRGAKGTPAIGRQLHERCDLQTSCSVDLGPTLATHENRLTVLEATYGLNQPTVKRGNVTAQAKIFCDGKSSCEYQVAERRLGDPAPGLVEDFEIQYQCGVDPQIYRTYVDAPAEKQVRLLTCPVAAETEKAGRNPLTIAYRCGEGKPIKKLAINQNTRIVDLSCR